MPQFDPHYFSSLGFWSLVSFAALLFLLYRYAFPVIFRTLEEREKTIKDSLDQAERIKQEAQDLMARYEAKLKGIHQEGQSILEVARKQAQENLEENEKRVEHETKRLLGEARGEIERERQEAMRQIRTAAAELSLLAAEKILSRQLTVQDHQRLVDEALEEISRQNPA